MQPLASADFRWLWFGQAISTFGDRFTAIAVPLLVYELTNSSLQLSIAFVSQVLAALLFGLWAGALSDRWDRLRTMIRADWLRAGLVALVPLALMLDLPQTITLGTIYLLSFGVAAITQFYTPAKVSIIPETVPEDQLMAANSLDQGTMKVMEFAGYSLAGLLIATVGASAAFVIDAVTFAGSAILLSFIKLQDSAETNRNPTGEGVLTSIRAGLAQLTSVPIMRRLSAISLLAPLAIGATIPLTVIFLNDTLGDSETFYGFWQAAIGLGLAIGIFLLGRFASNVSRETLVTFGVITFGFFQLLAILLVPWLRARGINENQTLLFVIPLVMLTAAGNGSIFLGIRTIVQENTPGEMIGRVFGAVTVISSLAIAIGQMLTWLAEFFSATSLLIFWSLFLVVVGAIAHLLSVRQRTGEMAATTD